MRILMLFLWLPILGLAQPPTDRYNSALFSTVTETNNIKFSTAVPQPNPGGGFYEWTTGLPLNVDEFDTSPVDLYMDIFEPAGDTLSQRPLVIVAFGGGFLSGSRDHWSIRLICEELAKRGYVTVSIDYRLGMNVFDSDLANRAVYRGLQDIRSAVRFFRADAAGANTYKVDPEKIFLGGHSSGAFMALHNAYLEKESERPLSTYQWTQDGQSVPDQGCLDCAGDNQSFSGFGNGVFSLAGALGFTDFIETANDPKLVMFHSTDDGTVPYDSGEPFSSIIWLVVGSDLPTVYGSLPISIEAAGVGLPYQFYSYTNRGHGVHEDGATDLYDDIIPGISDWFFAEELQPDYSAIQGDNIVCDVNLDQAYDLGTGTGVYFDWQITGGTFTQMNTASPIVSVSWDAQATDHSLLVIPYSGLDAKGDTVLLDIDVLTSGTNVFQGITNDWADVSNWSQGNLPTACDDVRMELPSQTSPLMLQQATEINSLYVAADNSLTVAVTGTLIVRQKDATSNNFALDVTGNLINQGMLEVSHATPGKEIRLSANGEVRMQGEGSIGQ